MIIESGWDWLVIALIGIPIIVSIIGLIITAPLLALVFLTWSGVLLYAIYRSTR